MAASTVWEILQEAGADPAPERSSSTSADFLRSQAEALSACDFFETVTLSGARIDVFTVIEHANRRIRVLDATAHPTAPWMAQAARHPVMDRGPAAYGYDPFFLRREWRQPSVAGQLRQLAEQECAARKLAARREAGRRARWGPGWSEGGAFAVAGPTTGTRPRSDARGVPKVQKAARICLKSR
ncbi:hypothetical protein ACFV2U_28820 [Streptomyces sp. NPDC059697]|uniref:hypothetical protein n=1 Tax=Streptomyces sp. NPDC059697 TaxID=3346912 RepID=UPI003688F436